MTGSVIAFPALRWISDETPPAVEVIVAPFVTDWCAWLRLRHGFAILELTPSRAHAVEDGWTYASRKGLPFHLQNEPLGAAA